MAKDDRLEWWMTELDQEMMNRRMEARSLQKENQYPSILFKSSVSEFAKWKAKAKAEEDRIKGVTEMEKQEKKKQKQKQMEEKEKEKEKEAASPQPTSNRMKGISCSPNFFSMSPHMIPGNPDIPWPPPEEGTPWGFAGFWHSHFS